METAIEERVDKVEIAVERFVYEMKDFKDEMKDFKDEMKDFKDEMKDFKDEMRIFKDEMRIFNDKIERHINESKKDRDAFQEEMKIFQREMQTFKENEEKEHKRMNKQWGEISNKMGTLVEDIVAPSIPRIVRDRFNIKVVDLSVRRKRELNGLPQKEWDAIAVSADIVFLNCTKSTLRSQNVDDFLEDIKIFRGYFPEYKEKSIIGILASLYIDEGVLRYAEKKGLLVLGIGEEIMEILNSKDFEPVRF